jgi:hypothetical protein
MRRRKRKGGDQGDEGRMGCDATRERGQVMWGRGEVEVSSVSVEMFAPLSLSLVYCEFALFFLPS